MAERHGGDSSVATKQTKAGRRADYVVKGFVPAARVVTVSGAKSLHGQQIDIKVGDGNVTVDKANVVKTDMGCDNGVIHMIDQAIVLGSDNTPATAIKAGNATTLVAAAKAAGLVEALSSKRPVTVFAPTNTVLVKLPARPVETPLKSENQVSWTCVIIRCISCR